MLGAFHIGEGVPGFVEGKYPVDHGVDLVRFQGSMHLFLHVAAADIYSINGQAFA
jgi:hypothetical protein